MFLAQDATVLDGEWCSCEFEEFLTLFVCNFSHEFSIELIKSLFISHRFSVMRELAPAFLADCASFILTKPVDWKHVFTVATVSHPRDDNIVNIGSEILALGDRPVVYPKMPS